MHFLILTLHLLTLTFVANAYVIPIRRIRMPPPIRNQQHRQLAMRQLAIPPAGIPTLLPNILLSIPPITATIEPLSQSPTSAPTTSASVETTPKPTTSTTRDPAQAPSNDPQPSQTSAGPTGPRKYVFAHHMVGNTFPYKPQDWSDDIALAHASGIDGFALNTGRDEWESARIADAYDAALQSSLDFKLFISLDMTSLPCGSASDAQKLRDLVNAHISHPNQLQYDSRAFVSTFAGETCNFGQGSVPDGWKNEFAGHPDLNGKIYFVPSFFIDPTKFGDFRDVMDGDFNWNSGWPIQVTTSFAKDLIDGTTVENNDNGNGNRFSLAIANAVNEVSTELGEIQNALSKFIGSTDTDKQHLEQLAAISGGLSKRDSGSQPVYMAAVSPWFFTHYGQDSFNKNFVFLSDQHLYSKRWESIIASRDQFDIVQILTWNDYGESHYVGPIKGAQPNSQAWVDGMEHTGWLELTAYYAAAFKTGEFPNIEKDKIFMWSRTHPTLATAPDPVGQPANFELFEDAVWAVVMTTAPSTVTLSTSSSNSRTFNVPAGLTKLSIPIIPGGMMKGTILRAGQSVVELNPPEFTFQGSPKSYNFNAFVASATAE